MIELNKIYCADNVEFMRQLPDEYVDLANRRIANVTREMAGEWKPLTGNGSDLDGLPLFEV